MKGSFELSVTLCDALVIVLMLLKTSKVSVQAVQRYREIYLTAHNGSISSPYYPKIYPKNIEWTWIIQPTQYTVILETKEMDLYRCYLVDPAYEECSRYDHVTITDYGMYCNGIKPDKVISFIPWTKIYITFKSLNAREQCRGNGFKAYYRLVMETTVAIPKTFGVPTHLTDKNKPANKSKEILEVTIPIIFGVVAVAIFLIGLTIWCCRKKSSTRQSPSGNRARARIESRNRLLGLEVEQRPDHGRPAQGDSIHYSDLLRNDIILNSGVPCGPPPSYDEIGRNDNLNQSHNLEFPPSYETAMSESTAHSPERLNQPAASGIDVRENPARPRLLNHDQLPPNISNEVSSRERREVFV